MRPGHGFDVSLRQSTACATDSYCYSICNDQPGPSLRAAALEESTTRCCGAATSRAIRKATASTGQRDLVSIIVAACGSILL